MDSQPKVSHRSGAGASGYSPDELKIMDDLVVYFKKYAKERPQTLALACLGIGFVLGWKLKPW